MNVEYRGVQNSRMFDIDFDYLSTARLYQPIVRDIGLLWPEEA